MTAGRMPDGDDQIALDASPSSLTVAFGLDGGDGLTRFTRHESSALFAVPGGAQPGEYVSQRLLES